MAVYYRGWVQAGGPDDGVPGPGGMQLCRHRHDTEREAEECSTFGDAADFEDREVTLAPERVERLKTLARTFVTNQAAAVAEVTKGGGGVVAFAPSDGSVLDFSGLHVPVRVVPREAFDASAAAFDELLELAAEGNWWVMPDGTVVADVDAALEAWGVVS